jgi:zinc protease
MAKFIHYDKADVTRSTFVVAENEVRPIFYGLLKRFIILQATIIAMTLNLNLRQAVLLVLSYLFFIPSGFGQYKLADTIPTDLAVRTGVLPNGLHYYIRENHVFRNVQLRLVVNAGSVLEDDDQLGLAHFMEHMNFNGLKHFPKNELVAYLQSIGGSIGADLNANTGYDATNYILWMTTGDEKKIEKGFTILSDWSHNALLDTTEINKERGVVLEESRLHKAAVDRMRLAFVPVMLNGSKYSERLPIGKDSIIQHFRPESLRRFYDTWYRPDLEAVIVVGDINPDDIEKKIIKHFSNFVNPANEIPRPAIIPIPLRAEPVGQVVTDKEFPNTLFELYNYIERRPNYVTWGDYRQKIVEQLFNLMLDERLAGITQQANAPFFSGHASFEDFFSNYRTFSSVISTGDKPLQPAIDSLMLVISSIRQYGFLDAELERAKSALLRKANSAYQESGKTPTAEFAGEYVNNYLSGAPIVSQADQYQFVQQVLPTITRDDMAALEKKLDVGPGSFALVLSSDKPAGVSSGEQLIADIAAARQLSVTAYQEKEVGHSLMDHLPEAGSITHQDEDKDLGTINLTLGNGITVTLKPTNFKNDDIRMDAWRWGGVHHYPLADKFNAMNAAQVVRAMGIEGFTKTELDKFLAGKTVHVQPYLNPYEDGVEGNCGAADLETFLQLVHLYLSKPGIDKAAFNSFIERQESAVQNLKVNPMAWYADTLEKIEYRNNPWANGIPSPADYAGIDLQRSMEIYKETFSNCFGMHFTFVGSFDPETMLPLLEKYLASLPAAQMENKYKDEGMRPVKGVVQTSVKKGVASQGQVTIVFTGEGPYTREDILKLNLLVGLLNVRIFQQLREEMGGTYNASMTAVFNKRPYQHYAVTARIPCAPENADRMSAALFDLINSARDNGVDKDLMNKFKQNMMNHHAGQMKTNEFWLQSLSSSWVDQEDPVWVNDFYKMVENISVRELKETANKYLDTSNYIRVQLLPE